MIVLPGQGIGLASLGGLVHENSHQWWGDNVSDANFDMTFFKECMATLATQLYEASEAAQHAGGRTRVALRSTATSWTSSTRSMPAGRPLAARAVAPHSRHLPRPLRRGHPYHGAKPQITGPGPHGVRSRRGKPSPGLLSAEGLIAGISLAVSLHE